MRHGRSSRGWVADGPWRRVTRGAANLLGVSLAAVGFLSSWAVDAADVKLTPTLSLSEEYSTNVDLDPDGEEDSSWITRVTPGARLRAFSSRASVGLDAALSLRHQTAGDDEGFNLDPAVAGVLDAELVENRFFVEGGASVSRQTLNTEDTASTSDQQTVQTYRLSPILRSQLGSVGVGELRYIFDQELVSESDVSDETGHAGVLTLSGGEDFRRLRWTLGGRSSLRLRSDAGDITGSQAEVGGEYAITRAIHPTASVGYQVFHEEQGLDFESPIWRAGLHLIPNRRFDLTADYGLRDDRYSPAFLLKYEMGPRTRLFSSYQETLGTAQQRLSGTLGVIAIDPETGEFIDDRAGTPFDPRTDPFDIDDDVTRVRLFTLLVAHDWRRMTATVRGSWGKEEDVDSGGADDSGEEEDVVGLDFRLQRRLTRDTSLEGGVGYIGNHFDDDDQDDDEYFLMGGLRHRLGESISAFALYGYRWQDSTNPEDEFKEHRIGVGLNMEF